ncbi:1590_t:CDS:2 [Ambispora gerdemannii]|uniref:1590_t:CDS:1 n=1 Tax=Ambispora gerdemannii TaxID=144530 RepID=A0A9N8YQY6_9GLOM|nr:1590_t:CDS:2 [Ambispora gerdemannii]
MSKNNSKSYSATFLFLVLISLFLLENNNAVVSASQCDPSVFNSTSAPLKQVTNASSQSVTISGTVNIKDGCTFTVDKFIYFFAFPSSYWYGSNSIDPGSVAVAISDTSVKQYDIATPVDFKLKDGSSFSDFSVLKLITTQNDFVIAYAELRHSPTAPPNSNNSNQIGSGGKPSSGASVIIDRNLIKYLMIGVLFVIWGHFNRFNLTDPAILEQNRIASQLGPCPKGGYHELRSHYTNGTLFWAFCLGLPRFCGYSRKKTVCKKCNATFEGVHFPEPGHSGPYTSPPPSQKQQQYSS